MHKLNMLKVLETELKKRVRNRRFLLEKNIIFFYEKELENLFIT